MRARSWGRPAAIAASIAAHVAAVLALAAHQPSLDFAPQRAVNVQLVAPPSPLAAPPKPKAMSKLAPPPALRTPKPARAAATPSAPASVGGEIAPHQDQPRSPPTAPSIAEPAVVQPVAASGAEEDPLVAYRRRVWTRLAAHAPAARPGSGAARVAFGLDLTGAVRFVRLVRSSGRPDFDRACLAAVRAAAPFPAAPPGARPPDLVFEVPIRAARP